MGTNSGLRVRVDVGGLEKRRLRILSDGMKHGRWPESVAIVARKFSDCLQIGQDDEAWEDFVDELGDSMVTVARAHLARSGRLMGSMAPPTSGYK